MTERTRGYRLELTLLVVCLVIVSGFVFAWRANAAAIGEPTGTTAVVRLTPDRASTTAGTSGVRVHLAASACEPTELTVLAPEDC